MINTPDQIQVTEDKMKEALIKLLDIKIWKGTHDEILDVYKNVKDDIIKKRWNDGETIKVAKEDFKAMYDFFSEHFCQCGEVFTIAFAIKMVAEGRVSKNEIETLYRGKNKSLQDVYYNIEEIVGNDHYIYMATVAIIC
jgi:ArsR family metal-binding transcriptional regulator